MMEASDKAFSDVVDIVKSWIPRRSEPANVSRDFWMPDHSCRVCYECDSQFTIFNRRHHCRLCGRVFCAKCTANSVPVSPSGSKSFREEVERIRVCNYCFKQWEQEKAATEKGMQAYLSRSPSELSMASTKSSGTMNESFVTVGSMPHSTGPYHRAGYSSNHSFHQSAQIETSSNKLDAVTPRRSMELAQQRSTESIMEAGDPSTSQFGFHSNRSDEEDDDEYAACHSDSETQNFQYSNDYYSEVDFDEAESSYHFNKTCTAEESDDVNEICSPVHDNRGFRSSLGTSKLEEEAGSHCSFDGTSSSIYGTEGTVEEPVDFENNGLLWLPPEPEDEEDETKDSLPEDDDDANATGDWGFLRSSNSFGSGECRSGDRSNEEHKKAMKNVVDGHFRALVAQLLQVENLPVGEEDDKESWLEIITSLSWEAANFLKPDTSKGGGMDPGGYVKVKCIACGHRSESMLVKGVVCKKNVAHRRMTSKVEKPHFLLLGGALEYQRVTNLLSSFDTLLQQEMDHLKMAVAKIDAHHPNVLLVEKSVSRFAQDYLLAKNISLVLNIRRPLLERIARCTGAQIVPSIDHLSSQKLGFCDLFHVEKFFEEHGSAGQGGKKATKTLMFFEGCPKPLGCTVLLKGAKGDELKKVKHVVQYGVFAAYHLAVETSFLADEGASLPELPLNSPITVGLPDMPSCIERSISTIPGFTTSAERPQLHDDMPRPNSTLASSNFRDKKLTLSLSFKNQMAESAMILETSDQAEHAVEPQNRTQLLPFPRHSPRSAARTKNKVGFLQHHEAGTIKAASESLADGSSVRVSHLGSMETSKRSGVTSNETAVHSNPMTEKQQGSLHQNNGNTHERTPLKEEFPPSPSDHRSILVSLSTRCVWKGTVCERAHLFRIKYYGNFDKPLGRFLVDYLFDQSYQCRSCDMPSEAHVHCYTHQQGSLTISVRKLPEFLLPGERAGKIWMWHRCLRCPRISGFPPATRRVVMSDAAWGLSFGKFLELSFSNNAAASRVACCGHSLHRDCLRFYGFGRMVACFRYASINVHSVKLPPPKLDFSYQLQEWIQKEANELADSADLLFSEVLKTLHQIAERQPITGYLNDSMKVLELHHCIFEFQDILQKEKAEFEESLQKVVTKEVRKGQPVIDVLELNKLRRQLLFQSYLWDQRLVYAARSDASPTELLSGCLPKDKEKISSIEKSSDPSLPPKPQGMFTSLDVVPSDSRAAESFSGNHQEGLINYLNHSLVNQQKRDMELESVQVKQSRTTLASSTSAGNQLDPLETGIVIRRALSDGQFPITADLSDTLDAKWRGESGPPIADASISDSLASAEVATIPSVSEDSEERGRGELAQSSVSAFPIKLGDSAEELLSWIGMPFLNIYRSFNRNWGSTPRFGTLSAYNPIYIFLFHEIERKSRARLLLPVGVNDTVIPVYDEEPTSIISYVLVSTEYHFQMSDERERISSGLDSSSSLQSYDSETYHTFQSIDETSSEQFRSVGSIDDGTFSLSGSRSPLGLDPLNYNKAMHVRVSFVDEGLLGKVKYTVTCYYAKRFDALRRTCCPSELDFIRSLSRCKKWGAQGGKSNVFFAKTLDDRFIVKQVTKTELESFIKFAPEYFKYLSESIGSGSPTCLAKILGIYQVTSKHLKGGKELKMDVLVMENLLFGRSITRLYDLKGSSRSRYNPDSSGNNKVLLDQNLIEAMPTSPIFVGNKAKRLLERAVWNDTSFLASIDVMDYSLLVGVDEEKHELVLGIIDFMRQYTWDKHLETWVKASGILGGPKNVSPTVISPKQYKKRFRKAMSTYFLMVPDQWSPPTTIPSKSQTDLSEDYQQSGGVSIEP